MNAHYTKEEVVKNDFLFVSYKHEDTDIVTATIDFLMEQGVRLWYDADLVIGEKWPEVAEKLIKHENCRGVIFFNSEASFKSEPIYQERGFTLEKIETCNRKGQPFPVFPVNIGKPSTQRLLKAVFASLPEDDRESEKIFPLKYLQGISSLFSSDTIYCYADPENSEEYKQRLVSHIKKALPSVIDAEALSAREIAESLGTAKTTVSLGLCRGKSTERLPAYFLTKDQRVDYQGASYFVEGGAAYETVKMLWRPVYCDDEMFVLLSENIVDVRNGGDMLKDWLANAFADLAFTPAEREGVLSVRLLSEADIAKSKTPDLLVFDGADTHWWLDARSSGALQKVVKKDGSVYNSGYNFRTKKSGVRPVICVKKEFLTSV